MEGAGAKALGRGCAARGAGRGSGGRSRRAAAAGKVYLQLCGWMGGARLGRSDLRLCHVIRGFSHRRRGCPCVLVAAAPGWGQREQAGTGWRQEGVWLCRSLGSW